VRTRRLVQTAATIDMHHRGWLDLCGRAGAFLCAATGIPPTATMLLPMTGRLRTISVLGATAKEPQRETERALEGMSAGWLQHHVFIVVRED
jgi:hypothetical protein